MKISIRSSLSVLLACLFFAPVVEGAVTPALLKKQMFTHLDFIDSVFESKYAPAQWKEKQFNWSLQREYESAKKKIQSLKDSDIKSYQRILKAFFLATRDYHVQILFHSTEQAMLPFLVKGAEGKYFICYVDRQMLPMCDLDVGDEIISFGGKPIQTAVDELRKNELGNNASETDQAHAELYLTQRLGVRGDLVPKGPVIIEVRKKRSGEKKTYELQWIYFPELIQDLSKVASPKGLQSSIVPTFTHAPKEAADLVCFQDKMVHPYEAFSLSSPFIANPHGINNRKSYLPAFGEKIWSQEGKGAFDAYLFSLPNHDVVGYVRIPHYNKGVESTEPFKELVKFFENHTQALVIDQINNGGGYVFYCYSLLSLLTDKPLATPLHRLTITQSDVQMALELLPLVETIKTSAQARELLGETINGYPIDLKFIQKMKEYCQHVLKEWSEGHTFTKPIHLFGVDEIQPHPSGICYTKPIIVLNNPLCFSCADLFPAILQDNRRGLCFGQKTAGAGGFILQTQFPNHLGVVGFSLTASLTERPTNKQTLENLGVSPDVGYSLTERDLKENYRDYKAKVIQTLTDIVTVAKKEGK